MKAHTRLTMSAVMIILSALFAVLVSKDSQVASAVALWYVAILLTVFFLSTVWKKP